jgi:hypothetical protein
LFPSSRCSASKSLLVTVGRTYHVNLVRLHGFCFDAAAKALVYEYMESR